MKIAISNIILETNEISYITDINYINCDIKSKSELMNKHQAKCVISVGFKIKLYNNEHEKVIAKREFVPDSFDEYEEIVNSLSQSVYSARDQLIQLWDRNYFKIDL